MKWLIRHKGLVLLGILLIILIGLMIGIRQLFFAGNGGSVYGNRLDGIEQVKINEDTLTKMETDMKDTGYVKEAHYVLEGRIVSFIVTMQSGVTIDIAKTMGDKILSQLTKEQLEYYDIQLYLLEDTAETGYTIIGYKHKTREAFVW